ncbi:hypothetical protein FCM35_KLT17671 [Carex littledalei]|uniref:Uncharacterized protein n=1 Tax=Carex littledalei TaxID=544730 RepID=A0A833RMA8_9POAL|nr:hypothetical protein FCM35_KLT17671 [Carex littledalei]
MPGPQGDYSRCEVAANGFTPRVSRGFFVLEGEACKLGIKVSTATSAVHASSLLLLLLHLLLLLLLLLRAQPTEARSRGGRRGARNRAGGLLGVEEIAYTVGLGRKSHLGAQERERGIVGSSSGALDNGERGGGDKDEREAEERSRRQTGVRK